MAGKNINIPEKGIMNVNTVLKGIKRPYILDAYGYVANNYTEEMMDTLEDSLDCPRCQMFCYHEIMRIMEIAGQVEQNLRILANRRNVNQKAFLKELNNYEFANQIIDDFIENEVLPKKGKTCDRMYKRT